MRTDEIIQNLKYTAKKHENDKVFTGQLNISSMCKDILPKMEQLKAYEDAEEQGLLIKEENVLKFYYCESEDKYLVGQRVGNLYYAEIDSTGLHFTMSRYLPWGKHIVDLNTTWKEHTYPSEPVEIPFFEWLQGYIAQLKTKEEAEQKLAEMKGESNG